MMAQDQVLLCQFVEVAANSLRADGEVLHQFLGTDITLLFNQFDNTVVTLCLFHSKSLELFSFSRIERINKSHR